MRTAGILTFSVLALAAAGCASDRDAAAKRIATMQEDITRLQAENDHLSERLDAIEAKNTSVPMAATPAPDAKVSRPPLKVVKLVPGEGAPASSEPNAVELAADERPDAPGERPVIRLRGRGEDSRSGASSRAPEESR